MKLEKESPEKKALVILTTHFGSNFSGGSLATVEIFSRLEKQFSSIAVIGTLLGEHPFSDLTFHQYRSRRQAIDYIKTYAQAETVFYGDFYNAYYFILAGRPFYFTYHDNWPELRSLSLGYRAQSVLYWNIYKWIFKKATQVITVSEFKKKAIETYSNRVHLIRNGFKQGEVEAFSPANTNQRILMIGNIDSRKYRYALNLFDEIDQTKQPDLHIDIYGHARESKLAEKLSKYPFVELKGFRADIPFHKYSLLLHTSAMENLPLVFCEAIYHNLPVLAFNVGGAEEVIDSDNGRLIKPGDTRAMLNVLADMIKGNEKFSPDRDSVLKHYDWDLAAAQYWSVIENQIKEEE
ncbi:MAG: hypothetical protein Roseis2KO_15180 [Roseivirga sp.]